MIGESRRRGDLMMAVETKTTMMKIEGRNGNDKMVIVLLSTRLVVVLSCGSSGKGMDGRGRRGW